MNEDNTLSGTRRKLLTAASGVGIASLAGCTSTASGSLPAPQVNTDSAETGLWKQIDETQGTVFKKSVFGQTLTANAHTLVYENAALRGRVKEETLGKVSGALNVLFASRIDFNPDIDDMPAGVGEKELTTQVRKNAVEDLKSRLKERGVTNISESGGGEFTVNTGETATVTKLSGTYSAGTVSFPLPDGKAITLSDVSVPVELFVASWTHNGYVLIGGGAYPGENFKRSVEETVTDAITVSVDINLRLKPDAYRTELHNLVKTIR